MPQLGKGGKFVFGWSIINPDRTVRLPDTAIEEYAVASEGSVILITGSRTTGGFCVSKTGLIAGSALSGLFDTHPALCDRTAPEGAIVRYKSRLYCRTGITGDGRLCLSDEMMDAFSLSIGDKLLSIRGSWMAFVMGVKGPLIKMARDYPGEIIMY